MKRIFCLLCTLLGSLMGFTQEQGSATPYYIFPREGARHIDISNQWKLVLRDQPIQHTSEIDIQSAIEVAQPTSVQMAYFKAGRLPDPYQRLNSKLYNPLEQKLAYYNKKFTLPPNTDSLQAALSFEGLDYYSRVWLNGKLLAQHEGMFGGPVINITNDAHWAQVNEIWVEVKSANHGVAQYNSKGDQKSVMKSWFFTGGTGVEPFFHFGMWNGARIELYPRVHLERPFLYTQSIHADKAVLGISAEIFAGTQSFSYDLHYWQNRILNTYHHPKDIPAKNIPLQKNISIELELHQDGKKVFQKTFTPYLIEGRSFFNDTLELPQPKLWNPVGLGTPNLYRARLILKQDGVQVDASSFDFGVRTITQERSAGPQTEDRWANWQFVINGKRTFIKGMNWMPVDALSNLSPEKYEWLIRMARDGGIQMLRIWGAGYMETKTFYDICNRYGMMVWQDFPIANMDAGAWPQAPWEALVCQNIYRLRNEPSLAVWCGGNEFNPYSLGNTIPIGILERNLATLDPTRMFLRTSPDAGSMHAYPDFDPTWYKKYSLIPFVAETGIHSLTDARGNRKNISPKELNQLDRMADSSFKTSHPEFIHHFTEYIPSRVPRMLSRATHLMRVDTASYESLVDATQIGAGEFYQVMSDVFQANYPITTGLLPWTYNRPWPVVAAINMIDAYGQPSAPYYFLKRTYQPNHVMMDFPRLLWKRGETLPLVAKILPIGNGGGFNGQLKVQIFDAAFRTVREQSHQLFVAKDTTVITHDFGNWIVDEKLQGSFFFVLVSLLNDAGQPISKSVYWPRIFDQLQDPVFYREFTQQAMAWPEMKTGTPLMQTVKRSPTRVLISDLRLKQYDGIQGVFTYQITNAGKAPAFMNTVEMNHPDRVFYASDNYFWLSPGETQHITVQFSLSVKSKKPSVPLVFKSWNAPAVLGTLHLKKDRP